MNIIKKTDVLSSITLIVISVIALWQTIGLTKMSYVFPRSIAIILLFLSSIYLINSIIKIIRNNETSFFDGIKVKEVLIMGIGMIGYIFSIIFFGFLISSVLYMTFVTWYLQKETKKSMKLRIAHSFVSSLLFSLFFFFLFKNVFLVPLPEGVLFSG